MGSPIETKHNNGDPEPWAPSPRKNSVDLENSAQAIASQISFPNMELGASRRPKGSRTPTESHRFQLRENHPLLEFAPTLTLVMQDISWVWSSECCRHEHCGQPPTQLESSSYTQQSAYNSWFSLKPTKLPIREGPQKSQVLRIIHTQDKDMWWCWSPEEERLLAWVFCRPLTGEWISTSTPAPSAGGSRQFQQPTRPW